MANARAVEKEFEDMPEIPAKIYEQIDNAFTKYLFFETVRPGHRSYTCTACHKEFDEGARVLRQEMASEDFALFHAKHNDIAQCPHCGTTATVKNVKMCDISKLWESNCVAVFLKNSHDDVWIRCIYADRGYQHRPKEGVRHFAGRTLTFESNIYHLQPGRAMGWKRFSKDSDLYRTNIFEEPFSWNHGMFMEKYDYHLVWGSVGGIDATFLRYNGANTGDYCRYGYNYPIRYLCHYAEHPQLEMLLKLGHKSTVRNVVLENCENKRLIDWSAKKPWELFRLTHKEYNRWAKTRYEKYKLDVLKVYRRFGGRGEKDFDLAEELESNFYTNSGAYSFIAKVKRVKLDIRELSRYLHRVQANSGGGCWQCPGITLGEAYTLWEDYIDLADGLGRLATVSLMPKDLKGEHDALLEEVNKKREREARLAAKKRAADEKKERERMARERELSIQRDAKREAEKLEKTHPNIAKFYAGISAKYAWGNEQYTVVVPTGSYDILYDGMKLGHCVGNVYKSGWLRYLNRTRAGESFLLFLRHADKPTEPYCTLEVEPGGVVRQKRIAGDAEVGDEVKAFLALWQAAILPRMTKKDKEQAAKSREIRLAEYAELRSTKVQVHTGYLRGKLLADVLEADLMDIGFAEGVHEKNTDKQEREAV